MMATIPKTHPARVLRYWPFPIAVMAYFSGITSAMNLGQGHSMVPWQKEPVIISQELSSHEVFAALCPDPESLTPSEAQERRDLAQSLANQLRTREPIEDYHQSAPKRRRYSQEKFPNPSTTSTSPANVMGESSSTRASLDGSGLASHIPNLRESVDSEADEYQLPSLDTPTSLEAYPVRPGQAFFAGGADQGHLSALMNKRISRDRAAAKPSNPTDLPPSVVMNRSSSTLVESSNIGRAVDQTIDYTLMIDHLSAFRQRLESLDSTMFEQISDTITIRPPRLDVKLTSMSRTSPLTLVQVLKASTKIVQDRQTLISLHQKLIAWMYIHQLQILKSLSLLQANKNLETHRLNLSNWLLQELFKPDLGFPLIGVINHHPSSFQFGKPQSESLEYFSEGKLLRTAKESAFYLVQMYYESLGVNVSKLEYNLKTEITMEESLQLSMDPQFKQRLKFLSDLYSYLKENGVEAGKINFRKEPNFSITKASNSIFMETCKEGISTQILDQKPFKIRVHARFPIALFTYTSVPDDVYFIRPIRKVIHTNSILRMDKFCKYSESLIHNLEFLHQQLSFHLGIGIQEYQRRMKHLSKWLGKFIIQPHTATSGFPLIGKLSGHLDSSVWEDDPMGYANLFHPIQLSLMDYYSHAHDKLVAPNIISSTSTVKLILAYYYLKFFPDEFTRCFNFVSPKT
ncbi:hypothetical protein H4Q26_000584 [Puccinia striiformis f. sp. tritici PST-130]|uniref:Uncharacterized protein n=2 Tax=Puccinia striiformis f. sp. tritici TaxID=168172 RepID=A0A0L0VLZ3_9BASI|nr:hypothetical protein Pst134EB_002192 [Puccinia striiformis f. sp. tritici]KAI9600791.1 hypothetical protein H4Q26_000584 [Puccinia striiformis f. sp. tritici PST-130]KNF00242.1 hypothetical protein PSTG_06416 [Puccinia striiformis f. sp. tritici PST-78]